MVPVRQGERHGAEREIARNPGSIDRYPIDERTGAKYRIRKIRREVDSEQDPDIFLNRIAFTDENGRSGRRGGTLRVHHDDVGRKYGRDKRKMKAQSR